MAERRRGLGKGISALIPTVEAQERPSDIFFDSGASRNARTNAGNVSRETQTSPRSTETTPHDHADDYRRSQGTTEPDGHSATMTGAAQHDPHALVPIAGVRAAEIAIVDIVPNRLNPRQVFDEDELEELAASLREVGLLQPIVVRPAPPGTGVPYELIMGERRFRAAVLAQMTTIPSIIRETEDTDMLRDALLENLHRAQLNPLEEASAYKQLLEDFACTQEELSRRVARSRPQISNTIRLLKLPPLVQRRVAAGVLSAGHARALLGLEDAAAMERLAQRIVAEGLSVRSTEEIVSMGDVVQPEMRRRPLPHPQQHKLNEVASRLADTLDTRVKVAMGSRRGRVTIDFASLEDLDRIISILEK